MSSVPWSAARELAVRARARAETFRWLAEREPARRVLTEEECHILAREADEFAAAFSEAADSHPRTDTE